MSSEIKADKWSPASGTSATIGDSGDTYTIPSGVTLDVASGATLDTTGATVTGLTTGSLVKISGGSASSAANHDFQSFMDTSKYNAYQISFSNVVGLAGNTFDFQFLDGSSVSGAGYWGAVQGYRSGDTGYVDAYENQSQGKLGTALYGTANKPGAYLFWIYNNPNSNTFGSSVYGHNWGHRNDFDDVIFTDYTIAFNNNNNTNGFRVHASGNDATTFDYTIYGLIE